MGARNGTFSPPISTISLFLHHFHFSTTHRNVVNIDKRTMVTDYSVEIQAKRLVVVRFTIFHDGGLSVARHLVNGILKRY
jgi:hypothetical protein